MTKLSKFMDVKYKKNNYVICLLKHLKSKIPIVLDKNIFKIIILNNYNYKINERNHVYYMKNNKIKYLHNLVLETANKNKKNSSVIHLNNIHFDNRICNLEYDVKNKSNSKNTRKKKRIINLTDKNINASLLPTFISYMKEDKTHGDRFQLEIKSEKLLWRSTSSKKLSTRYKLEETKKFLRYLIKSKPQIFDKYSMNGDLNKIGKLLLSEFIHIIKKANYTIDYIYHKQSIISEKTHNFLKEKTDDLTDIEIFILYHFEPSNKKIKFNVNQLINEY
jgi:hypothetical protein